MKYLKFGILALTLIGTLGAQAARVQLDTAGTLNIQNVNDDQWPEMARKEIDSLGNILGVPGGVIHTHPQNQRSGEDCWSFALNQKIQSYLFGKEKLVAFRLSPEHVEFWHIYDQIQTHLDDFETVVALIKSNPRSGSAAAQLAKLKAAYGLDVPKIGVRTAKKTDKTEMALDNLFQPDVGNDAATAIDEIEKYGLAPYRIVKTAIKTDDQEKNLETAISNVTGQIIVDAVEGRGNLAQYREGEGGINEKLFQLLKNKLEPIFRTTMLRPTDTWVYNEKTYTPLTLLAATKHLGIDLKKDFRPFTATPAMHLQALKAMAIALLTDNEPVPIGITLLGDKVTPSGKTDTDFAEKTGLFTDTVCPTGGCVEHGGGHEILVVNFIAATSDGSELNANATAQDKIALLQSGKLLVKGLIIENSWGVTGGLTVDAQPVPANFKHHGGYYVLTPDFLLNSGSTKIDDMYDFLLPLSVAKQFPRFKKSTDN
jgi:hypothetical protein